MKTTIFLDIDGVFTSKRVHKSIASGISCWSKFDPVAIDFFNKIGEGFDVEFVLCSTWREHFYPMEGNGFNIGHEPVPYMFYSAGFKFPMKVCRTFGAGDKEVSDKITNVMNWVKKFNIENWILVDDYAEEMYNTLSDVSNDHFVTTDCEDGLLSKHMYRIIELLNKIEQSGR